MSEAKQVEDLRNRKLQYATTYELKTKTELQKKYTQSWLWRSLPCLLEVEGISHDPRHLAFCLSVKVEETLEALDGLHDLGIIKKTGERWERVLKYIYFSDRDINPVQTVTDHLLISGQLQNRLTPKGNPCFYRTSFVATSNVLLRDFYLRVEALMAEFIETSNKQTATGVVGLTFSGVSLGGGKQNESI